MQKQILDSRNDFDLETVAKEQTRSLNGKKINHSEKV